MKRAGGNCLRPFFCFRNENAVRDSSISHWNRCRRVAVSAPGEAGGEEEQRGPEQEWEAEFKEYAENKSGGGEDAGDPFDEGIAELKDDAGKIGLQGGAIVFHQRETDMGLGDG